MFACNRRESYQCAKNFLWVIDGLLPVRAMGSLLAFISKNRIGVPPVHIQVPRGRLSARASVEAINFVKINLTELDHFRRNVRRGNEAAARTSYVAVGHFASKRRKNNNKNLRMKLTNFQHRGSTSKWANSKSNIHINLSTDFEADLLDVPVPRLTIQSPDQLGHIWL